MSEEPKSRPLSVEEQQAIASALSGLAQGVISLADIVLKMRSQMISSAGADDLTALVADESAKLYLDSMNEVVKHVSFLSVNLGVPKDG